MFQAVLCNLIMRALIPINARSRRLSRLDQRAVLQNIVRVQDNGIAFFKATRYLGEFVVDPSDLYPAQFSAAI